VRHARIGWPLILQRDNALLARLLAIFYPSAPGQIARAACRDDAKKLIAAWFPGGIYDTKHLATLLPEEMQLHETSLGQLYSNLMAQDSPQVTFT